MRAKKEINILVGEQIKLARDRRKMTQEQLAEQIEVSPQFISDLERGVVGISLSTLKRICITLNTTSDQILFGTSSHVRTVALENKCKQLTDQQFNILLEIISKYIEAVNL